MNPAEHLARRFHETYERLAPQFGYTTRGDTRAFDPATPNGKLMVAVCAEITDAAGMAHAAGVLAEFAKTAPGRLPQRVQDAIDVALADGVALGDTAALVKKAGDLGMDLS